MIEVSIFYMLGGLVMLPSTTFLLSRLYYTKLIHSYERKLWVYENTDNIIDVNKLINEMEIRDNEFKVKQKIISSFLERKPEYNEIASKSNLVQEIKNKFENN
jgi:hypothetical protein